MFDEQFIEFCATTLNIHKEQSFESNLSKLEYLAHKGFKEHLGALQIWYRDRLNDHSRDFFWIVSQRLGLSVKHTCEECCFSIDCQHDCCFQLLKFHYEKRIRNQGGGDNIATDTSDYLRKRSRKQFEEQNIDLSTISTLENSNIMKDRCDKKRYLDHDQLLTNNKRSR